MPNHVKNILKLKGSKEDVNSLLESISSKDAETSEKILIDFNKIIPMPKTIRETESGSITDQAIAVYAYKEKGVDSYLRKIANYPWARQKNFKNLDELCDNLIENGATTELGKKFFDNIKLYGVPTWYEWANRYWGTKWNAYSIKEIEDGVSWCTAWDGVPELMVMLSSKFPDVELHYFYANEDTGYGIGIMVIKNGDIIQSEDIDEGSEEAINWADKIWNLDV